MGGLSGHPNIVNILRVGVTTSGRPYIVMPYLVADSLAVQLRREGPVSWPDALRIAVKLCGALETAHRTGTLHRDIKPANVLINDYGEAQLSDFGIAHIEGGYETATGFFSGTIDYTAPEVMTGGPATVASDIYSLGATIYALIAGSAAHERKNDEDLVAQYLRISTTRVPDMRPEGIPDAVCAAIEHAMSIDPAERPASAAEFGRELQSVQRSNGLRPDSMAITEAGADSGSTGIVYPNIAGAPAVATGAETASTHRLDKQPEPVGGDEFAEAANILRGIHTEPQAQVPTRAGTPAQPEPAGGGSGIAPPSGPGQPASPDPAQPPWRKPLLVKTREWFARAGEETQSHRAGRRCHRSGRAAGCQRPVLRARARHQQSEEHRDPIGCSRAGGVEADHQRARGTRCGGGHAGRRHHLDLRRHPQRRRRHTDAGGLRPRHRQLERRRRSPGRRAARGGGQLAGKPGCDRRLEDGWWQKCRNGPGLAGGQQSLGGAAPSAAAPGRRGGRGGGKQPRRRPAVSTPTARC